MVVGSRRMNFHKRQFLRKFTPINEEPAVKLATFPVPLKAQDQKPAIRLLDKLLVSSIHFWETKPSKNVRGRTA